MESPNMDVGSLEGVQIHPGSQTPDSNIYHPCPTIIVGRIMAQINYGIS